MQWLPVDLLIKTSLLNRHSGALCSARAPSQSSGLAFHHTGCVFCSLLHRSSAGPEHAGHLLLTLDGPRTPTPSSRNQNPRSLQGATGSQLTPEASPTALPEGTASSSVLRVLTLLCSTVLFHPNMICRHSSVLQATQTLQPAVWAPCQLVTVSSGPLLIWPPPAGRCYRIKFSCKVLRGQAWLVAEVLMA